VLILGFRAEPGHFSSAAATTFAEESTDDGGSVAGFIATAEAANVCIQVAPICHDAIKVP